MLSLELSRSLARSIQGGHFSVTPTKPHRTKQQFTPQSNVLTTKFLSEEGVGLLTDTLVPQGAAKPGKAALPWLLRRVEVIAGKVTWRVECAPAFNYARDTHDLEIGKDDTQVAGDDGRHPTPRVVFKTPNLTVDLRTLVSCDADEQTGDADPAGETQPQTQTASASAGPLVDWHALNLSEQGHKGLGVFAEFEVCQGEVVDFVFRQIPCAQEKREEETNGENGALHVQKQKAQELGVGIDTLAKGVNKLRPDSDPVCTPELVTSLFDVRLPARARP